METQRKRLVRRTRRNRLAALLLAAVLLLLPVSALAEATEIELDGSSGDLTLMHDGYTLGGTTVGLTDPNDPTFIVTGADVSTPVGSHIAIDASDGTVNATLRDLTLETDESAPAIRVAEGGTSNVTLENVTVNADGTGLAVYHSDTVANLTLDNAEINGDVAGVEVNYGATANVTLKGDSSAGSADGPALEIVNGSAVNVTADIELTLELTSGDADGTVQGRNEETPNSDPSLSVTESASVVAVNTADAAPLQGVTVTDGFAETEQQEGRKVTTVAQANKLPGRAPDAQQQYLQQLLKRLQAAVIGSATSVGNKVPEFLTGYQRIVLAGCRAGSVASITLDKSFDLLTFFEDLAAVGCGFAVYVPDSSEYSIALNLEFLYSKLREFTEGHTDSLILCDYYVGDFHVQWELTRDENGNFVFTQLYLLSAG